MFTRDMTDEELIEVVRSMDLAWQPLHSRFGGDDEPITMLMDRLGVPHILGSTITGAVLRECVARGIAIPRPN